jgi:cobyrinic acid a,c-diamide synthase
MRAKKAPPRVVLASPCGHSGKTVLSCGISTILRNRGTRVQAFKKGPDYIDPSWLTAATGRPCRNLDLYMMGEGPLISHFFLHTSHCDFALVEGNMGLYDGLEEDGKGSTAHIARLLKAPVILIVNTEKMTRSVAALVEGYRNFEPDTMVSGVILNNVSGERHARKLVGAIERHSKLPVLGVVPREESLTISERHLGLIPFGEKDKNSLVLNKIASFVEKHIDVQGLFDLGRRAEEFVFWVEEKKGIDKKEVKIGVFYDHIFHFYYPENLEALENEGAEILFVNSVVDEKLPEVDGLYIGGGFPELYLEELSQNRALMDEVVRFVESGKPLYAECGGLMYLCEFVHFGGRSFKMAGLIPAEVYLMKRPQGHGYVEAEIICENPFHPVGALIKGHEFHHSTLKLREVINFVMRMRRGKGGDGLNDGILYKNMFASYTHVHVLGVEYWAKNFVNLCKKLKAERECNYNFKEATNG